MTGHMTDGELLLQTVMYFFVPLLLAAPAMIIGLIISAVRMRVRDVHTSVGPAGVAAVVFGCLCATSFAIIYTCVTRIIGLKNPQRRSNALAEMGIKKKERALVSEEGSHL